MFNASKKDRWKTKKRTNMNKMNESKGWEEVNMDPNAEKISDYQGRD